MTDNTYGSDSERPADTPGADNSPGPHAAGGQHHDGSAQPSTPSGSPQGDAPTAAYPTDSFGRPAAGSAQPPYGSAQPTYDPNQPYGAHNGYQGYNGYPTYNANGYAAHPGQPGQAPAAARKDRGNRKGAGLLVGALAIGLLAGGASGAGVATLVGNNNASSSVSQPQGSSNVVINDPGHVNQIAAVAAKASPSVVTIQVAGGNSAGTGSGVILSDDGYVLTNTHVVTLDGASAHPQVQVKAYNGKLYDAQVVGTDPISDLAVIKLKDASGLTPIEWADSDKLNVGDATIAIGAPLGLSGTVTNGIVSALDRSISIASSAAPSTPDQSQPDQGQSPFDFWNFDLPGQENQQQQQPEQTIALSVIQTDAAINPGNSGGALLNDNGQLIGINVAIANAGSSSGQAGSIGVGFALPSDLAKRVSSEIIKNGKATHGLLGASVGDAANVQGSDTVGAVIADVSNGGAAAKAGLKKGDVITEFNGVPITGATDLTAQVRALAGGADTKLTYVRGGDSHTISVTLGTLSS